MIVILMRQRKAEKGKLWGASLTCLLKTSLILIIKINEFNKILIKSNSMSLLWPTDAEHNFWTYAKLREQ
jgi:hypothetical protein